MRDLREAKIGELVAEDYRKAGVFKKFGLDFCCGGGKTLAEACAKKGIKDSELISALRLLDSKSGGNHQSYINWTPDFLADYIINAHHSYVRENIPLILEFAEKAAKVHGHAQPELIEIEKQFKALATELMTHMQKEEIILFPYIKQLAQTGDLTVTKSKPPFGSVANPIQMMESEHEHAGDILKEIRRLSNDFTPPEYACNTWKVLYAHLADFENDLHTHIHLENNILFPKVIRLEEASAVEVE